MTDLLDGNAPAGELADVRISRANREAPGKPGGLKDAVQIRADGGQGKDAAASLVGHSLEDQHPEGGGVEEPHAGQVHVDEEIALTVDQIFEQTAQGGSGVDVQVSIDCNDDPAPDPAELDIEHEIHGVA